MQDLLSINDPDWASFQNGDPEYLLRVTGNVIRRYCGWHIFPNLAETRTNLPIQSKGLIQLPSLHVTDVERVILQGLGGQADVPMERDQYTWFRYGVVAPIGWQRYGAYSSFYFGPDQFTYLPVYQFGYATVRFKSGYDVVPDPVKEVAYELATLTGTMKVGNVKEVASPGFRLMLSQDAGMNLNSEQKSRLASYRLPSVR